MTVPSISMGSLFDDDLQGESSEADFFSKYEVLGTYVAKAA
jgi:hypothetical protein